MIEAEFNSSGPTLVPVVLMSLIIMGGVLLGFYAFSRLQSIMLGMVGLFAAVGMAIMGCILYESVLDHRYPTDTSEVTAGLVKLGLTRGEAEASLDKIMNSKNGETVVLKDKVIVFNGRDGVFKLVPYDGTLDD